MIIELDGGQHQDNRAYDDERTKVLNQSGYQVLRFWNHDVLQKTKDVLEVIYQALSPTLSREKAHGHVQIPFTGEGADRCN